MVSVDYLEKDEIITGALYASVLDHLKAVTGTLYTSILNHLKAEMQNKSIIDLKKNFNYNNAPSHSSAVLDVNLIKLRASTCSTSPPSLYIWLPRTTISFSC